MSAARGIDHLVLAVRDLDAAAARYEAWGFTLTPRAQHPWGTANRLVQFDGCFLELLEIDRPELIAPVAPGSLAFGARVRDFLARREGFAMLVFDSGDARADQAAFRAAGLATYAPFDFSRAARLPDGGTATVGFSLAFVTDPRAPDTTFFVCQQHAPQHFWKPAFQRHANGAHGIVEVVMQADDPAAWRGHFAGMVPGAAISETAQGLHVRTARGAVAVLGPAAVAARFGAPVNAAAGGGAMLAGFRLSTTNLAAVSAGLAQAGTPSRRDGERLVVSPAAAFGCGIEFVAT